MGLFNFLKKEKEVILGIEFPIFDGQKLYAVGEGVKKTNKYQRKDYYYKLNQEKLYNYIATIKSHGFIKNSDIKYAKQNGYIIIEQTDYNLHIAFHVNK